MLPPNAPALQRKSAKAHKVFEKSLAAGVNGKETTTAIPKTYDAIRSAAGADMQVKGRT